MRYGKQNKTKRGVSLQRVASRYRGQLAAKSQQETSTLSPVAARKLILLAIQASLEDTFLVKHVDERLISLFQSFKRLNRSLSQSCLECFSRKQTINLLS